MSAQHATARAVQSAALLSLRWAVHCERKIFLECVRRAGHTPEIHDSDPTTLVMTCYHCGQRFSLPEADLQAGDLTENEVRSNISGARFI